MIYKIAYIDEDRGWVNTFYQTFKKDFEVLKIIVDQNSTIESILEEIFSNNIEAVVTDYLLEESGEVSFNGNIIIDEIKKKNPHFPIIMLTSHTTQAIGFTDDVHIIYSKEILNPENKKEQEYLDIFKSKINLNISNYYKKIEKTESRIEELVEKQNSEEGISLKEEEELTKLYLLLDEFNPDEKVLPTNLVQKESISKLYEFVNETKLLLDELKKNKE